MTAIFISHNSKDALEAAALKRAYADARAEWDMLPSGGEARMEETARLTLKILHGVVAVMWAGGAAFAGYRIYQLLTFQVVVAEVLKAETDAYMQTSEGEDAHGFRETHYHRVYRAQALVRYRYRGQEYTAVARNENETQSWNKADRLVQSWKPGTQLRVRVHAGKPDQPRLGLGLNLATFKTTFALVAFGFAFLGFAYCVKRAFAFFAKAMGAEAE